METEEQRVPWWQRELNARLARQARRREAIRRLALQGLGSAVLVGAGLLMVLVLAQDTRGQFARGTRHRHGPAGTPGMRAASITTAASAARAGGATLTLDLPAKGATAEGKGSILRVTLTDRAGAPLPGITIWLTIAGPVPYSGATTTDARGVASFPYTGAAPYIASITATAGGSRVARSTVRVVPEPAVATTEVTGRFYTSDDRCTFNTPPGTLPLFVSRFPTLNFAGRPFTSYGGAAGQLGRVAADAGKQAGIGSLNHFNAAFTGSLVARQAADVPFTFLIDDAFNLGVGGGAVRVRGSMSNPPASGRTALLGLRVVGTFNQGHLEATTSVTVRLPHPGSYPYEIDYAECRGGGAALRVSAAGQFLPAAGS